MPNPLHPSVLPDNERMRSTTAWILQREPVLVRIAPLVVLLVVAGLGIWIATAKIATYDSFEARIVNVRPGSPSDTLEVQMSADESTDLSTGTSIVVVPDGRRSRLDATVLRVDPARTNATLLCTPSTPVRTGNVTIRMESGRRTLLSELVATASAGGRR